MNILVAGGAGYIGSVLIPKLMARGYAVAVLDLLWFGNHLPSSVRVIRKDVLDFTETELRGYDQVIYLAGLSNDPMADYSPSKNFVSNAASAAYLAYLSKQAGIKRFIFGSTCSVYGYTVDELYDETSPAAPSYPYGISKLQGEYGTLQLRDSAFSVIVLRKGTVCGYSPRMRLDLVVNTMFKTAVTEKVITVNNPAIWRPISAIQDTADAYVRAIECNYNISGIFNIASGNYTLGELADYVHDGVHEYLGIDVMLRIMHVNDLRNYKVSIEKAIRVLSFKPRHDAKGIVKDLVENQAKFADFDNSQYYNIRTFKQLDSSADATENTRAAL
jgi:nucleoside-diphosphate-sugar epimerase